MRNYSREPQLQWLEDYIDHLINCTVKCVEAIFSAFKGL